MPTPPPPGPAHRPHRIAALVLAASVSAGPAMAQGTGMPSQDEWRVEKQFVTLPNGIHMPYMDIGNPDGEPLLLVHGYTDTSRAW